MTRVPTPPPEPALRNLLDEVIVPLLVERFLREHAGAAARDQQKGRAVSESRVISTVRAESSPR